MIAMPGVFFLLHRYWDKPDPGPIANWYRISFDASQIKIELTPPASPSIRTIPWSTIASAKFVSNGIMSSDEVWLYAKDRGKVFVKIPTEASGEPEFVGELASRKLLDVRELIGTNG